MKDDIKKDLSSIYDKIQKETAQSLKNYNDSLKAIKEQTKRSWAFVGVKEALFWCMCLSMILFVGASMLSAYGITFPPLVWQILYPCTFIPLIGYIIRILAGKNND
jgi:hypothetical protein